MSETAVERHAVKRGEIMRILLAEHPDYVSIKIVRNCLDNAGLPTDESSIVSYLAYLEDKGYVKTGRRKGERSRVAINTAAITAKGLDLIDHNNEMTDEGVIF